MKGRLWAVGIVALLGLCGPAQAGGDVAAGKAKSATCAGCHGAHGEGRAQNPALAGISESKFEQAIKDFKSGKRKNPMMKMFAGKLGSKDVANLAAYYSSLKK